MRSVRLLAAACVAAALAGCGGPTMAPVVGRVLYPDGSPLPGGQLLLIPDDPALPSPLAEIDRDGRFEVYTAKPGDGARLGSYKVAVLASGEDFGPKNPRPIDMRYADPATSGLTLTVEDKTNTVDLTVTKPGQKR